MDRKSTCQREEQVIFLEVELVRSCMHKRHTI